MRGAAPQSLCLRLSIACDLGIPYGDSAVPRTSRDRVELEILLEGASRRRGVGKALLLQMNAQIVEAGDHQN